MSMEKTDALPNDESKRKSKNKSVMSEKQSEVAVVQDPTSAKLDPEKSDRHDITGDRENVHGAYRVESENLKDKEGIPNPEVNKMQLKYSYREDIWGPVNPESKKQYDRDFLLQFQKECTHKPDGLPNIPDLVLSKMSVVQPLYRKSNRRGKQKSSDLMKSPRVQENIGYKRGPDNKGDKSDKTKSFSNENAKKMQTQFASKVAMVTSDIPQPTDLSQSHIVPPAPQQPQSKQPNYPTGQANRSSQEPLKMTHRPFHQQSYPRTHSPTAPPYYSSPPQQVWLKTAQTTPRPELTSQPPATGSDGQQRSAKNFRLVDPTTNKDVLERRMHDSSGSSSPHSGRSSANDTSSVGVEFTLDGASAADKGLNSAGSQGDWLHVFKRGLTSLLNERPDNNQIFDWIESNISHAQKQHSKFIRALVTIICQNTARGEGQSCHIDAEILKLQCPVLQRYIDNKFLLELQALYAVQALNHSLHSPPGLLRILFDVLCDEDVVTEEAFYNWKISDDPKESNGKGVALKSVRSFFTWLAEPEAEAN